MYSYNNNAIIPIIKIIIRKITGIVKILITEYNIVVWIIMIKVTIKIMAIK